MHEAEIHVCALDDFQKVLKETGAQHIICLLSQANTVPDLPAGFTGERLVLRFNDIAAPQEGLVAPSEDDVAAIIAFARNWPKHKPLLCQCWFGVSRSTAAAVIVKAACEPDACTDSIALELRKAAPFATPNPLMIAHADKLLGRQGALIEAVSKIGRGAETSCGTPFLLTVSAA
ncbi:protein tyrosine phosphatase [Rhodobacteraceae bacterium RKSG542]|uniref:tyrosine phosphatase family protein n=1 Tax=Pseudovibrio flavus TaxID=2529854 RepID=UPI0012BC74D1|nr:protein tyrosine phosphatase [Pseudovibrio flavus]MTI18711.1 protein tyrosine phosphatase [Pseudovibrio flavus]